MSRKIVDTESGRTKSEALRFAVISIVAGVVVLLVFVLLNGGVRDNPMVR